MLAGSTVSWIVIQPKVPGHREDNDSMGLIRRSGLLF